MNKVFLDSDVLLDLLLDRTPFSDDIAAIIEVSIDSEVKLCTSPVSITNIRYIIGRLENKSKADLKTKKLLQIVDMENIGQTVIDRAVSSKFKDFEDSVQNYCAEESGHNIIITRNTKDYKESTLSIFTPKEYFAKIRNKK
ncbi:MAG: PIN domain-containing protein [Saprospiraceae bacterium]